MKLCSLLMGGAIATTGGVALAQPASASTVTSAYITSQPHSVQEQCALRIYHAQGPGAWEGWRGSFYDMSGEHDSRGDKSVNSESGAAGWWQVLPTTWDDLCSDL